MIKRSSMGAALRLIKAAGCVLSLAATSLGMAHAASPTATKVTIATNGIALSWYPCYVAEAAGLFKQEGLDIEWVEVGSGSKQAAAVLSGGADMTAMSLPTAFKATADGAKLVAISALFDRVSVQLVLNNAALAKTGLSSGMKADDVVPKLSGLTIAVTGVGGSTDTFLRSLFKARGLDPDKMVTIQPLGNPMAIEAAFEHGTVDGYALSAPFPEQAEIQNIGKIVVDPMQNQVPELTKVPYAAMVTSRQFIEEKPEVAQAVVRALAKAMRLAQQKPEAVHSALRGLFANMEPAVFERAEPAYRGAAAKTPVISQQEFDSVIAWMNLTADAPYQLQFQQAVDNTFAEKAAAEMRE